GTGGRTRAGCSLVIISAESSSRRNERKTAAPVKTKPGRRPGPDGRPMLRQILQYPDPRLRRRAAPVAEVTDATRALIDDMAETMYNAPGIGLAAVQVGVLERVVVIDLSEERNQLQVFVNPEIVE